jgi:hypothetical protein
MQGDEMKTLQKIFNLVAFSAFFLGSVSASIYLTINLFLKFGWLLCVSFIAFLSIITLIYCGKSADT